MADSAVSRTEKGPSKRDPKLADTKQPRKSNASRPSKTSIQPKTLKDIKTPLSKVISDNSQISKKQKNLDDSNRESESGYG